MTDRPRHGFVFYDVLDTVRTAPAQGAATIDAAMQEALSLLRIDLLLGTTRPLLSEVQAFDSLTVLRGAEDADFLALVRAGDVAVRLVACDTILDAFAKKLEDGFLFSAWPELNGATPEAAEQRRLLLHAVRHGEWALFSAPQFTRRFTLLQELSKAVGEAPLKLPPQATTEVVSMAERLRDFALAASEYHNSDLLRWILMEQPNRRGDVYERLRQSADDQLAADLREVVDYHYNAVVGDALLNGLDGGVTTTVRRPGAERLLDVTAPAERSSAPALVEASEFKFASPEHTYGRIERVGWQEVRDFTEEARGRRLTERERELQAAKLLARLDVGQSPLWVILSAAAEWGALAVDVLPELSAAAIDTPSVPPGVSVGDVLHHSIDAIARSMWSHRVDRALPDYVSDVRLFGHRLERRP